MNFVKDCLLDLFAAFPHFKPPDPDRTLSVYARALSDLEEYELRAGVEFYLRQGGKFFPTVSEIRAQIRQLQPQPLRKVDWVAQRVELEKRAWDGDFVPREWERLESELRHVGRDSAAEMVHQKRRFFEGEPVDIEQYRAEFELPDEVVA